MLKAKDLYKEYQSTIAVRNISFEISPGEIFGLLGPNGAGKTTTIRMILNIIKPSGGSVTFYSRLLDSSFQSITGYLPEERGLYKKSRVIDILRYFGELKGMTKQLAINEARRWLERLEIGNYETRKLEELSKGNQQKVQFISSVIHDPRLLILDEPFSGFDPVNQKLVKGLLKELADSGRFIIISTHQMEIAEALCTRIMVINKGEEVLKGSIEEIKRSFCDNSYYLGYNGDGIILNHFPEIKILFLEKSRAKIQILTDIDPVELLRRISQKLNVNHFSAAEPTLNDIYLRTIEKVS